MPRDAFVRLLAEKYGETVVNHGLTENGLLFEVTASEKTGTWSLLFTRPDGIACGIAAGKFFEKMDKPERKGPPA